MIDFLMESVVVSFALGGVVGAVVAVHLTRTKKESVDCLNRGDEIPDGQRILQRDVDARVRIPPRR